MLDNTNFLLDIKPGEVRPLHIGSNFYVTVGNLPENIAKEFDNIDEHIRETEFNNLTSFNSRLAGHIKKEFAVPKQLQSDNINNFLIWLAGVAISNDESMSAYFSGPTDKLLGVDQLWINYMSKHEFNPIHSHSGLLSFVIWNKIPFDIEEELKVFPDVRDNMTSAFNFILGDPPRKAPIFVNKKMQNYICIFPSYLNHCVYPFYTSDDYRVSFAGNIFLRNNK